MSKHTPGPWIIQDDNENSSNAIVVDSATESFVIAGPCPRSNHRDMADLKLIAAAPDLLHRLKDLVKCIRNNELGDYSPLMDEIFDAEDAISKAEGKEAK